MSGALTLQRYGQVKLAFEPLGSGGQNKLFDHPVVGLLGGAGGMMPRPHLFGSGFGYRPQQHQLSQPQYQPHPQQQQPQQQQYQPHPQQQQQQQPQQPPSPEGGQPGAGQPEGEPWTNWDTAKTIGSFVPGVSTAISGYDAVKNFAKGNFWTGMGHLGSAALGLIPGVGSVSSGLLRAGSRAAQVASAGGRFAGVAAKVAPKLNAGARNAFIAKSRIARNVPGGMALRQFTENHPVRTSVTQGLMGAAGSMMDGSPAQQQPQQYEQQPQYDQSQQPQMSPFWQPGVFDAAHSGSMYGPSQAYSQYPQY